MVSWIFTGNYYLLHYDNKYYSSLNLQLKAIVNWPMWTTGNKFFIVFVHSRVLERPPKRSRGKNQLIHRRLSKTKSIGSGSDPDSQAGRQADCYDGWCLELRRGRRHPLLSPKYSDAKLHVSSPIHIHLRCKVQRIRPAYSRALRRVRKVVKSRVYVNSRFNVSSITCKLVGVRNELRPKF